MADRSGRHTGRVEWNPDAPGAMNLPGGGLVRGRSLRTAPAPLPEWGLYATWRHPEVEWPHAWIRWPDFGIPIDGEGAWRDIAEAHRRHRGERVEVACGGGRGRTGTLLAALVMLDGLNADEAVTWVRHRYHPRAVETPWQRSWLRRHSPRAG